MKWDWRQSPMLGWVCMQILLKGRSPMTTIFPWGAGKSGSWRQWPSPGKGKDMTINMHSCSKKNNFNESHMFLHCFKEIEILLRFSAFSPGSSCHWPCPPVVSLGLFGWLSWVHSWVWGAHGSTENTHIWLLEVWDSLGRLFLHVSGCLTQLQFGH